MRIRPYEGADYAGFRTLDHLDMFMDLRAHPAAWQTGISIRGLDFSF